MRWRAIGYFKQIPAQRDHYQNTNLSRIASIGRGAQKSLSTMFERPPSSHQHPPALPVNPTRMYCNSPRSRLEFDVGVRQKVLEADPDDAARLVRGGPLVRGGTAVGSGGGDRFELHRACGEMRRGERVWFRFRAFEPAGLGRRLFWLTQQNRGKRPPCTLSADPDTRTCTIRRYWLR